MLYWLCINFYPRPPRGGRLFLFRGLAFPVVISIHALREEGDALFCQRGPQHLVISIHALREEGDVVAIRSDNGILNFYPRPPRGGRPADSCGVRHCLIISIHALREEGDSSTTRMVSASPIFLSTPSARRATPDPGQEFDRCGISIHALREEGDHG